VGSSGYVFLELKKQPDYLRKKIFVITENQLFLQKLKTTNNYERIYRLRKRGFQNRY
jgi:hypothetical protein